MISKFLFILTILCGLSNASVIKLSASAVTAKPPNANLTPMLRALTELKQNLIKENSQAVIQGQTANAEDPNEVISANFPEQKINVMSSLINSQNANRTQPKISSETKYVVLSPSNNTIRQVRKKKTNRKPRRRSVAKTFDAAIDGEKYLAAILQTTEQTTLRKTLKPMATPPKFRMHGKATMLFPLAKSSAPTRIESPRMASDFEMADTVQIPVIMAPPKSKLDSSSIEQRNVNLPDASDYLGDSQEVKKEEIVPKDSGMVYSYITKVNKKFTDDKGSDYVTGDDVSTVLGSNKHPRTRNTRSTDIKDYDKTPHIQTDVLEKPTGIDKNPIAAVKVADNKKSSHSADNGEDVDYYYIRDLGPVHHRQVNEDPSITELINPNSEQQRSNETKKIKIPQEEEEEEEDDYIDDEECT